MSEVSEFKSSIQLAVDLRGKPLIASQLLGNSPINSSCVSSFEDYSDVYKIRHDLIHASICDCRNFPFGEIKLSDLNLPQDVTDHRYYEDIKMQSPDYIEVKGKTVKMLEITISIDVKAYQKKMAKYSLIVYVFKDLGYSINYEVIVVHPLRPYMYRDELIKLHKLNDITIDFIKLVCENTSNLLHEVRMTVEGPNYHSQFNRLSEARVELNYTIEDVKNIQDFHNNKVFHNISEIDRLSQTTDTPHLSYSDTQFLNNIADAVDKVDCSLTRQKMFNPSEFREKMIIISNTKDLRSILPLPMINANVVDSSIRTTLSDLEDCSQMASFMRESNDNVLSFFGDRFQSHYENIRKTIPGDEMTNDHFLMKVSMPSNIKEQIALEGPGRKSYIKRGSFHHMQEEAKHANYSLSMDVDVSYIERLSFLFSQKNQIPKTGDIMIDSDFLQNLGGFGLDYVKICQSIYREVNINSMRRDRRKKYILKPTGVQGVFVLLFKGPKLRCGELANLVWFKVLINNEILKSDQTIEYDWPFKQIYNHGQVSASKWLSCDVHRLDHYIRGYDKILMSYYSIMTMKYRSTVKIDVEEDEPQINCSLIDSTMNDTSNILGLIILIYLEDRRSTSKMLQFVRYLVMGSLSIFDYQDDVFDKIIEPIRSPLQLYFINKMLNYNKVFVKTNMSSRFKVGKVRYDVETKTFHDTQGGAQLLLPRPLVSDINNNVDFSEILSEMYFCMLFNKNQDDPTHASFQILEKMLEGESSMQDMKRLNRHLGYKEGVDDLEWALDIIKNPHTHQFSRRAIELGSKLLSYYNDDPNGDRFSECLTNANINKTIDSYATFKSSSTAERLSYNPTEVTQNPRIKCIEGVINLMNAGIRNTIDCVENYKLGSTTFQVFKKNQIGGVREILILPIQTRININLLETISRNICSQDHREMLTHGSIKFESMKDILYNSKKRKGERMNLYVTMDKSRWGPTFVPIQFLYLFTPYRQKMGSYFNFILGTLIHHQNKKCLFPDRLMRAWFLDGDNKLIHKRDPYLQQMKEKFLKDKELYFINESNMGQGILHYTSSLLHLAMISFRDELYKIKCRSEGFDPDDHDDVLSSDDSFSILSFEIGDVYRLKRKVDLFMKCQMISELLFNCRTSRAKSSVNPVMGEFNSLFVSNMTFFPTLLKFSLASVHPVNTDSFFRMVKESYSSTRQIVENGGSLELYLVASKLNKKFCEGIYHTGDRAINDLRQFKINNAPFHMGVYPIFDPSKMLLLGPEYHNYTIYKNWSNLSDIERTFFINSHKIIKGGLVESMAEFEEGDTILGGVLRIEASLGPITQLMRLRDKAPLSRDEMSQILLDDPLLIIKRPKDLEESKFKVTQKLYTTGAPEALKNIAASIYYGRVSATVSANCFYIPNTEKQLRTYGECLKELLSETPITNFESHFKFLYPRYQDYELCYNLEMTVANPLYRNIFEIQTIRKLSTHKIHTKLSNSVLEILEYYWMNVNIPEHKINRFKRDLDIIQTFYPLIKPSLQETLDQFSGTLEDKTKSVILLLLKLYQLKDKSLKGVIYGPGSNDVVESYSVLIERNYTTGQTFEHRTIRSSLARKMIDYTRIYLSHNHDILSSLNNSIVKKTWSDINDEELFYFLTDPTISKNMKKRVFMCVIANSDKINDIELWTKKTSVIMHEWILRQRYSPETRKYFGNFHLILFCGSSRLSVIYSEHNNEYQFVKDNLNDPEFLYEFFEEISEILNISLKTLLENTPRGQWLILDDKILKSTGGIFSITERKIDLAIDYSGCQLVVTDETTYLNDYQNRKIYSISTGLLPVGICDLEYEDFEIFNMSFSDIHHIGSFNQNFSVSYKSPSELLSVIKSLETDRPKISKHTREKLELKEDWKVYEGQLDIKEQELTVVDRTSNFFESLIMVPIEEIKTMELLNVNWDSNPLIDFLHTFELGDFFPFNGNITGNNINKENIFNS
jgi:hypothetical protein